MSYNIPKNKNLILNKEELPMDLAEKSVLELRNLAKENGIENTSKLKKSELIEELNKI